MATEQMEDHITQVGAAKSLLREAEPHNSTTADMIAAAQVHATLAVAAALADLAEHGIVSISS